MGLFLCLLWLHAGANSARLRCSRSYQSYLQVKRCVIGTRSQVLKPRCDSLVPRTACFETIQQVSDPIFRGKHGVRMAMSVLRACPRGKHGALLDCMSC